MENIFGGLVSFEKKDDLDMFVESIDKLNAIKLIEMALTYGLKNGIYSLEDSFVIYKSLTKLKEENEVDSLPSGGGHRSTDI